MGSFVFCSLRKTCASHLGDKKFEKHWRDSFMRLWSWWIFPRFSILSFRAVHSKNFYKYSDKHSHIAHAQQFARFIHSFIWFSLKLDLITAARRAFSFSFTWRSFAGSQKFTLEKKRRQETKQNLNKNRFSRTVKWIVFVGFRWRQEK